AGSACSGAGFAFGLGRAKARPGCGNPPGNCGSGSTKGGNNVVPGPPGNGTGSRGVGSLGSGRALTSVGVSVRGAGVSVVSGRGPGMSVVSDGNLLSGDLNVRLGD